MRCGRGRISRGVESPGHRVREDSAHPDCASSTTCPVHRLLGAPRAGGPTRTATGGRGRSVRLSMGQPSLEVSSWIALVRFLLSSARRSRRWLGGFEGLFALPRAQPAASRLAVSPLARAPAGEAALLGRDHPRRPAALRPPSLASSLSLPSLARPPAMNSLVTKPVLRSSRLLVASQRAFVTGSWRPPPPPLPHRSLPDLDPS
jgi:hypothetical protein